MRRQHSRIDWLLGLSTRELVIYLMELRRAVDQQPELTPEVEEACTVLRQELLRREWPVPAGR
ncbi:MAG TPA: hypothetical protein VK457_03265 [Chloroflexota bacterium]|jgi:hypothetical protein|nr:hypothetical protein [Chloroflexota bacterium]